MRTWDAAPELMRQESVGMRWIRPEMARMLNQNAPLRQALVQRKKVEAMSRIAFDTIYAARHRLAEAKMQVDETIVLGTTELKAMDSEIEELQEKRRRAAKERVRLQGRRDRMDPRSREAMELLEPLGAADQEVRQCEMELKLLAEGRDALAKQLRRLKTPDVRFYQQLEKLARLAVTVSSIRRMWAHRTRYLGVVALIDGVTEEMDLVIDEVDAKLQTLPTLPTPQDEALLD